MYHAFARLSRKIGLAYNLLRKVTTDHLKPAWRGAEGVSLL